MSTYNREQTLLQRLHATASRTQTPEQIHRQRLQFAISTVREETDNTRTRAREILQERNSRTAFGNAR